MDKDFEKIKKEADFQNQRIRSIAEGHKEPRDRFYYLADRARKHYDSLFENISGKSILVVGCSQGGVTPLARRGACVLGIDVAEEPIEKLKKAIVNENLDNNASAELMDAQNLKVDDDSIDIICCTGVLHHLDIEKAAKSWSTKLRSSGHVIMLEPMALNPAITLFRLFTPQMRSQDEHPLKPNDIHILKKYFGRVDLKGYVLTSLFSLVWEFLPNWFFMKERSLALLEKLDDALLRQFPFLIYLCWTTVITLENPRKFGKYSS